MYTHIYIYIYMYMYIHILLAVERGAIGGRVHLVTKAGSYLRLIDSCITQLKAQGPCRTCNASKEEEEVCTFAFEV